MRDHRLDSQRSKNEVLELIADTRRELDREFDGNDRGAVAHVVDALSNIQMTLDADERPLLPEGTWRALVNAVKESDLLSSYSREQFKMAMRRLPFLQPGDVR